MGSALTVGTWFDCYLSGSCHRRKSSHAFSVRYHKTSYLAHKTNSRVALFVIRCRSPYLVIQTSSPLDIECKVILNSSRFTRKWRHVFFFLLEKDHQSLQDTLSLNVGQLVLKRFERFVLKRQRFKSKIRICKLEAS